MENITTEELDQINEAKLKDIDAFAEHSKARAELTRLISKLCVKYKLTNTDQLANDGTINRVVDGN